MQRITPLRREEAYRDEVAQSGVEDNAAEQKRFWPYGWWKLMDMRIGIIPLPIYVLVAGLIAAFLATGKVPGEISMSIVILAMFGFTCAEVGKRLPILKNVGGGAIMATFIPSALAFYHVLPAPIIKHVTDFTKQSNFLYLFIASIIVGSILGMDRQVLMKGFIKIFVPLAAGSIAAGIVGTTVGTLLGLGAYHTFFFVVVPIMAGGVGEGAIPLSIGYGDILHQPHGDLFAQVLPPVMLGSLTAIIFSGLLNFVGKRFPQWTGEGKLQPDTDGTSDITASEHKAETRMDVSNIAAAGITAISLYLVGLMAYRLFGFPAPVAMLFIAVMVKLTRAVSPSLQDGAHVVYKFFSVAVTYPLLFAIGTAMTPWDKLVAAFHLANIITIVATVTTLMAVGAFVGRLMKMYPIEAAIVNACHSGQGGTGDVAILTAANRMQLMPFAQIATRIGGAITITVTLIVMAKFS